MYSDVECPYCGAEQDICHDDGYGYAEDEAHEQECNDCEKTFSFTTSISFSYVATKAECLNGGEHQYKPTMTVPQRHTKMRCTDCCHERPCSETEMAQVLSA